MTETEKIRISKQFQEKIYDFKARCFANGKTPPVTSKITELFAKHIDTEKIFQNEINKI